MKGLTARSELRRKQRRHRRLESSEDDRADLLADAERPHLFGQVGKIESGVRSAPPGVSKAQELDGSDATGVCLFRQELLDATPRA